MEDDPGAADEEEERERVRVVPWHSLEYKKWYFHFKQDNLVHRGAYETYHHTDTSELFDPQEISCNDWREFYFKCYKVGFANNCLNNGPVIGP